MTLQPYLSFTIDDTRITFDWNGETIDFSGWSDDAYGIFEYTTLDGSAYFVFDLQPVDDEVRIYIREQPSYGGLAADSHSTHRNGLDVDDDPWICASLDDPPTTVPHALTWAVYWAEQTAEYIRTGKPFS